MFNKLPEELQNHILDYAFGCKKDQNFYVNKEVVIYVSKKCNKCKKMVVFNKQICYGCYEKEIKYIYYMF